MLKRRQVIGTVFSAAALSILPVSAQNARKGIIVVYSRTGNTLELAQRIHEKTGYQILRLQLVKPYAENYNDMTYLARDEIRSDARREIATEIPNLSAYTDIYVGGPYWWGALDVPMRTFLKDHPLDSKRVHPFITSGSSSPRGEVEDIRRLCPKATIEPYFYSSSSEVSSALNKLDKWIEESQSLNNILSSRMSLELA